MSWKLFAYTQKIAYPVFTYLKFVFSVQLLHSLNIYNMWEILSFIVIKAELIEVNLLIEELLTKPCRKFFKKIESISWDSIF